MWDWILYLSIPFIAFAIIEELIYLIVNLSIFRTKRQPKKLKDIGE
ncbi:hypothetical protein ACFFF5_05715 [Lederbergia wuyishanensis]|uniref:ATP synthase F0 subunit 8 n=1 Tax=Lederbergia wuyishanensis TaxID=1347903 RepID=A0ABU0CYR2_9BACI|nr:hypothetical protein [Lederbergia wuyishanensis]MCJ8005920.1 hypothetical protein [Lederbergia wuyishanensis]MDQ0341285.1 hypothetical protein [Lederbergia wuyishanensis]